MTNSKQKYILSLMCKHKYIFEKPLFIKIILFTLFVLFLFLAVFKELNTENYVLFFFCTK